MPTLPPSILKLLEGVVLLKYSNFIALTILIYDFSLTLPDEIRLIWTREWRFGKILYLATRYPAFIDNILYLVFFLKNHLSVQECKENFQAATWLSTIGILVAQWILVNRTIAIWGKSKMVAIPLCVLLMGVQTAGIYSMSSFLSGVEWAISPFTSIAKCDFTVPKHNLLFVVYILIMFVELVILTLTIWKGVSQWRVSSQSNLVKVLYRDGVVYFAVLFAISISNFALCVIAPSIMREFILVLPQRVLHSVCTSRIILNLRDAASSNPLLEPETGGILSSIHFHKLNGVLPRNRSRTFARPADEGGSFKLETFGDFD